MNNFEIKCYLLPSNTTATAGSIKNVTEIRRFNLNHVSSDKLYGELIEKIKITFGDLVGDKSDFKTYWQDEENELIGFSSSSEMLYAIDVLTAINLSSGKSQFFSRLFKVYVTTAKLLKSQSEYNFGNYEEPEIHMGVVCDGCNGSVIGFRYKCKICPDFDLCSECKSKSMHVEHEFTEIPFTKKFPYFNKRFNSFNGKHYHHQHHHNQNQQNFYKNMNNRINETLNNFVPFVSSNMRSMTDPEQLKKVGENIKNMLSPLGIDVDYYVDNMTRQNNKQENNNENKSEEKLTEKKETQNESVKPEDSKSMDTNTTTTATTKSESKSQTTSTISASSTISNFEQLSSSVASLNEDSKKNEEINKESKSPFEQASESLRKAIINSQKIKEENQKNDEEMVEDSGFNLVDIEKELKIIRAIEQLRLMGYSDDGGWLTRLATAKNGNINAILDAVSPNATR
jgi:sequestosome 1